MNTDQLIDMLASDIRPVDRRRHRVQLFAALGIGAGLSLALTLIVFGVQPGLGGGDGDTPLLVKSAYAATLAVLFLFTATALWRPGVPPQSWLPRLVPVAVLGVLAAAQLLSRPASEWPDLFFGASWTQCPLRIAALSLPILAGLVIVTRNQAPTRLRRTGAAIGALAGSLAAILYALACTETSAAFVLIWYTLGIALAAAIGAAVGPRLLRW